MKHYWVSTEKFTCLVSVSMLGKIMFTAPMLNTFKGQHFENLEKWLSKFNGVQIVDLSQFTKE